MNTKYSAYAPLVLRIGLVAVFYYFGFSQIFSPDDWTGYLPAWTASLPVTQTTFVLTNGVFEVAFATLLLAGLWTPIVAGLLCLHLFGIAFSLGFTPVGVRDFGLAIATLALTLWGADDWTVDAWRRRKK